MKNRKKYGRNINKERKKDKIKDHGLNFVGKLELVLSAIFTTFLPIICLIVILILMICKHLAN